MSVLYSLYVSNPVFLFPCLSYFYGRLRSFTLAGNWNCPFLKIEKVSRRAYETSWHFFLYSGQIQKSEIPVSFVSV